MRDKINVALDKLNETIEAVYELERNREVSIVLTHLETAELWLMRLESYEE